MLGQSMPVIFYVGRSVDRCRPCRQEVRSRAPPPGLSLVGSTERAGSGRPGEVNGVCVYPGWERIAVQIDSGAVDTVGPKEVAGALGMKEMPMSKNC